MNVYDFDKTIMKGDTTTQFSFYCLGKYPAIWGNIPGVIWAAIRFGSKSYNKDGFKAALYKYLKKIPDIDAAVADFWTGHRKNVQQWYLRQKKDTDVIISASPVFLLEPIAKELGVDLIASPVDKYSGRLLGPNNSCEAKVLRFKEQYKDAVIDEFYSDSDNDLPLARLAVKAFKVKNGKVGPWKNL